ncbi:MAG: hypothetical protein ACRD11_13035 [Terriglobia bacterium]
MTLLDAKPPKPKRGIFKYIPLPVVILIIIVVAGLVAHSMWNFREERAVSRFLTTLEQGNFKMAYKLWQPATSYQYSDFLHDWGVNGDYGKIRSFEIIHSKSEGSHTVLVMVDINHREPLLSLMVDRKTKGLSYAIPF